MNTTCCNVPSSDKPPKPEWTGRLWYTLRLFALQAGPDPTVQAGLRQLFGSLCMGLPCQKCKEHYEANIVAMPYGDEECQNAMAGLRWIQRLRKSIQDAIDRERAENTAPLSAPGVFTPAPGRHRSRIPLCPAKAFEPPAPVSNHTPEAIARQEKAMHAAVFTPGPEQVDVYVPSAACPPLQQWFGHVAYSMRCFALQARPTLKPEEASTLVSLFSSLGSGLPHPGFQSRYDAFCDRNPFAARHASDPVLAMQWVQDLNAVLYVGCAPLAFGRFSIDAVAPTLSIEGIQGIQGTRQGYPLPPCAVYHADASCALGDQDPVSLSHQMVAIAKALEVTRANWRRGDCGCSAKAKTYTAKF